MVIVGLTLSRPRFIELGGAVQSELATWTSVEWVTHSAGTMSTVLTLNSCQVESQIWFQGKSTVKAIVLGVP